MCGICDVAGNIIDGINSMSIIGGIFLFIGISADILLGLVHLNHSIDIKNVVIFIENIILLEKYKKLHFIIRNEGMYQ